LNNKHIKTE
jgi:hypothetical protein